MRAEIFSSERELVVFELSGAAKAVFSILSFGSAASMVTIV